MTGNEAYRLGHWAPAERGDPKTATAWIEDLLRCLGAVRIGYKWQCLAHDGNSPALAVRAGNSGAVLFCHAGCAVDEILTVLALRRDHLFRPPSVPAATWHLAFLSDFKLPAMVLHRSSPAAAGFRFEAYHEYGDRFRKERLRHPVTGAKQVRWERRADSGEWIPGLFGTKEAELPLYRERDLAPAIGAGEPILLVESESSVDALTAAGLYATTWAGGAGSPPLPTLTRVLGAYDRVVLIADADEAGKLCAGHLRAAGIADYVLPGDSAGGAPGDDARDLLARLGVKALTSLVTDIVTGQGSSDVDELTDDSFDDDEAAPVPPVDPFALTDAQVRLLDAVKPYLPLGVDVVLDVERDHVHLYRCRHAA